MLTISFDSMLSFCTSLPTTFAVTVLTPGGSTKSDAMPWALVLFCVILGLLVSLNPSRRTTEIKRTKEE